MVIDDQFYCQSVFQSEFKGLLLLAGQHWPPEMSLGGSFLEDWVLQIEVLDVKK